MTTIVGIKTKEGVVLGSDRRASKGFFIGSKITQKITKIDDTTEISLNVRKKTLKDKLTMTINRYGRRFEVPIQLQARP